MRGSEIGVTPKGKQPRRPQLRNPTRNASPLFLLNPTRPRRNNLIINLIITYRIVTYLPSTWLITQRHQQQQRVWLRKRRHRSPVLRKAPSTTICKAERFHPQQPMEPQKTSKRKRTRLRIPRIIPGASNLSRWSSRSVWRCCLWLWTRPSSQQQFQKLRTISIAFLILDGTEVHTSWRARLYNQPLAASTQFSMYVYIVQGAIFFQWRMI